MGEGTLAGLIGSWKLVSVQFRMSDNGEIIDDPIEGVCTFDTNGRWTVVAVPSNLSAPTNDAERSTIFNRTIAFSGRGIRRSKEWNSHALSTWKEIG
jgi:hypothetical protein